MIKNLQHVTDTGFLKSETSPCNKVKIKIKEIVHFAVYSKFTV